MSIESHEIENVTEMINDESQTLTVGQMLAHYKISKRLGVGGMGEVYLAEDTTLRRKVALKVLPAEITGNRECLQRFEQEAFAASALNHPHILTIHEFGKTEEGTHFIVMEYVEGLTLNERRASSEMSKSKILDVAVQVASALAAAHEAGIIHRDIKPENIIVRPDGFVKVLDFGLAKLTEKNKLADSDAEAPTRALVNTNPGAIMGTAAYMSPEQARGLEVDARTDIWSLGVIIYEMLSGRKPFTGATPTDIIVAVVNKEPPPISSYAPDVPAELVWVVSKALQKEVDGRYQTAKEFLADLRRIKQRIEFESESERSTAPETHTTKEAEATPTLIHPQTTADLSTTNNQSQTHSGSSAEYIATEIKQHKRGFAIGLIVLLLVSIGLGYWFFANRSANSAQIESIAVMPFVNESGNTDVEYLSDGMTESLINSLSQLPKLSVKARSSVFRYKGKDIEPQQIAKELSVQAILNGRVVQRGDNLSLSLELVDALTGNQIWGEQYNRKLTDIVSLQNEIAQNVSNKLRAKLSGADERKLAKNYTENAEAYQLYLKGRYEWNKHTLEDLQKGIEYFNQAIEKDPNYALAYFGLSASYGVLGNNYLPPREAFPKAKAYAAKGLAIDDTLSEAHSSMAAVNLFYDWDWAEAEKELKRAQTLNPNDTGVYDIYGAYWDVMGRPDKALAESKRGQELDPLSLLMNANLGTDFYYTRQYDEAIAQCEKTVNLEPRYYNASLCLGQAYEQKKMYQQAIATFQKGMAQSERNPKLLAFLGHAYALSGERDKAQQALDELREMSKQRYVSPYLFAVVYAGLDDKDQTFAWLEKAYQDRSFFLIWLNVEPQFDPFRNDPRFQDLLRRVGLPQ